MSKTGLYTVERIVGKRIRDTKFVEYKVKWEGYPSSQNTWEPVKNLTTVNSLIKEFEERNKDKLPSIGGISKHLIGRNDSEPKQKAKNGYKVKMEPAKPQNRRAIRSSPPPQKRLIKPRIEPSQSSQNKPEHFDTQNNTIPVENSDPQPETIDLNISDIAAKIIEATTMKDKGYKMVEVIKKLYPNEQLIYIVEDRDGNRQKYNRERICEEHPQLLLDFYEKKVHEQCRLPS